MPYRKEKKPLRQALIETYDELRDAAFSFSQDVDEDSTEEQDELVGEQRQRLHDAALAYAEVWNKMEGM